MDSPSSKVSDEVGVSYEMKKKILVERNGVVDDVEMKKSVSLSWVGEPEPSPPRPRYLRYKPHRSKEILTRIQKAMEVRSAEIIEEEEEEEEEEEKSGCSCLKLLCLVYVLMHWSSYMSNTNSSSVHVLPIIGGGEEGYYWRNQTLTFKGDEEWRSEEDADGSLDLLGEEEIMVVVPEEASSSELMKEVVNSSNSVLESSWEKEIVDKSGGADNATEVQVVDEESCSTTNLEFLTTANLFKEEVAANPPLPLSSSHTMLKAAALGFAVLLLLSVVVVVCCCYFKKKKKPTTAIRSSPPNIRPTTAAANDYLLLSAPDVRVEEGHGGPTVELLSELEFHFQLPQNNNNSTTPTNITEKKKKKKKTATTTTTKVVPLTTTPIRRSTRLHNRLTTTPKSFRCKN